MVNALMTGNASGGDVVVSREGIQRGDFLYSAVFCALFGGNIEEDTKQDYVRYEQNNSFWGNTFLRRQFNSQTERALKNNVLTDSGISAIRSAVFADLQKLIPNEIEKVEEVYVSQSPNEARRAEITVYIITQRIHRKFLFEVNYGDT